MNNYFQHNLAAFGARRPDLKALPSSLSPDLKVQQARSGEPTLQYQELFLHSSYDPVKEARQFAEKIAPGSRVFLYGYGLGYHLAAILEKIGPEGKLVTVELNPEILTAALTLKDQSAVAGDPRFQLISGTTESEILKAISAGMKLLQEHQGPGPLEILFHGPSFQKFPENFPNLLNALEILLMERRVPAVFGDLEGFNLTCNRDTIAATPGLATLKGSHEGQAALLVSAGPSLDGLLPYLKNIHEGALLASVDTALPILTQAGLVPDYIFTLDPQETSFKHFAGNLDIPARLIFTPTANARVLKHFRGEKFVVYKRNASNPEETSEEAETKGLTDAGGSVACLGLDVLIQLGCGPIVLVGQDCAFTDDRTYSRNTVNGENRLEDVQQGTTLSQSHTQNARAKKQVKVTRMDGEEVLTNQVLYSYLRTLEDIARTHPETSIYNLCSHGARIEHIQSLGSVNELMTILPDKRVHES